METLCIAQKDPLLIKCLKLSFCRVTIFHYKPDSHSFFLALKPFTASFSILYHLTVNFCLTLSLQDKDNKWKKRRLYEKEVDSSWK